MVTLYYKTVYLPTLERPLDERITRDSKYFPFFKDYIGALDSTHIYAFLLVESTPPFRNKKGFLL